MPTMPHGARAVGGNLGALHCGACNQPEMCTGHAVPRYLKVSQNSYHCVSFCDNCKIKTRSKSFGSWRRAAHQLALMRVPPSFRAMMLIIAHIPIRLLRVASVPEALAGAIMIPGPAEAITSQAADQLSTESVEQVGGLQTVAGSVTTSLTDWECPVALRCRQPSSGHALRSIARCRAQQTA